MLNFFIQHCCKWLIFLISDFFLWFLISSLLTKCCCSKMHYNSRQPLHYVIFNRPWHYKIMCLFRGFGWFLNLWWFLNLSRLTRFWIRVVNIGPLHIPYNLSFQHVKRSMKNLQSGLVLIILLIWREIFLWKNRTKINGVNEMQSVRSLFSFYLLLECIS
jgi:hypothetical protein